MSTSNWYKISNENEVDSPSLLIYPDRIAQNIQHMLNLAGSPARLMPHVKTYKMQEVIEMMQARGIRQFKAATIAEAELCAMAGAEYVLVAHQLVGPKLNRLIQLIHAYPTTRFCSLIDNLYSAQWHQDWYAETGLAGRVWIDLNNAMDRSGHPMNEQVLDFYRAVDNMPNLKIEGLHVYDGSFRQSDFEARKKVSDEAFQGVYDLIEKIEKAGLPKPLVVAGGSPAFTVHRLREGTICSPGTCLIWDYGYGDGLPDQPFVHAGLVLTRIISKPKTGYITLDLGHKAIASENPIDKRVRFLNQDEYKFISQSEEHLVLEVKDWDLHKVGDVWYGVPYHICPTINLYEEAVVVENHRVVDHWQVIARKRKISI
jgi:3-hydroxy-D-aspartate aldolase